MKSFKAPWGKTLVVTSALATALCLAIPFLLPRPPVPPGWVRFLPPLIAAGAIPFAILGYALVPGALLIRRPFWTTRIPLDGLVSARFEPNAI